MEARLANIVHHMTGEADEESMSAWESLGSQSPCQPKPPAAVSRRRSSSSGLPFTPLQRDPLFELDETGILAEDPRGQEQAGLGGARALQAEGRRSLSDPAILAVVSMATSTPAASSSSSPEWSTRPGSSVGAGATVEAEEVARANVPGSSSSAEVGGTSFFLQRDKVATQDRRRMVQSMYYSGTNRQTSQAENRDGCGLE